MRKLCQKLLNSSKYQIFIELVSLNGTFFGGMGASYSLIVAREQDAPTPLPNCPSQLEVFYAG